MFDAFELSRFLGRPVRLFEFTRQSLVWRYAQADRDLTIDGHVWTAAQIERDEIKQTSERAKDRIKIRMAYLRDPSAPAEAIPATQALGDTWHPYIPSDTVSVRCLTAHYGDDGPPAVEWMGQVTQPAFTDVELELTCEPGRAIAEATNQGPKWQRGCWKSVYSTGLRGCNLIPGPIPVTGTLEAVAGNNITAAAFVPQQRTFAGGTAEWIAGVEVPHAATVTAITDLDATLDDVTGIEAGTVLTWAGGAGEVTAIDGDVVTLDDVTGLAVDAEVEWTAIEAQPFTAAILAHSGTTLTLDDVTGLSVGSLVTAHTVPLWTIATLIAVSGLALTAPEFAAAPLDLTGGDIAWSRPDGLLERRTIMSHAGSTLTILYGAADLAAGLEVTVRPGCPQTWAGCVERNNTVNFGGTIYKPRKTSTDGGSMSWD